MEKIKMVLSGIYGKYPCFEDTSNSTPSCAHDRTMIIPAFYVHLYNQRLCVGSVVTVADNIRCKATPVVHYKCYTQVVLTHRLPHTYCQPPPNDLYN